MRKILILSSNPRGDLKLPQETQNLKDLLVKNVNFDVQIEPAISIETLEDRLSRYQPFIVHFCGHGNGNQGLVFVDKEGVEQYLSNEKLTDIFKSYGKGIECVLLNACYTEIQADAITEYIPYVIGTSREILDKVAYYFSIGFYKGIAKEQSIETCYEWGYFSIRSNLENAEVVTNIDEINSKSRKVEVIDNGRTSRSTEKLLEIILKHNQHLESQLASNVSPELEQEFVEEGRRKRYKDNLRNILDNFGERIIHRKNQIDSFENKQRNTLIDKVQDFWIKGFLKPSLYFNTATDIDNDHPSGQILRPLNNLEVIPFNIEQSYDSVKDTDIPNQISDGQTLLILGEPGSGKTIALLQLAERLIAKSRENSKQPIPVVFNLSSWVEKQLSLEEWLIEELRDKYQVPKAWSKPWIERQELTLLLDGLDEVRAKYRNACVRAIRDFGSTHQATEMVVCSRIKDYEALVERLLLSSVICIQPLSKKQLLDFLENADDSLSGLKTVIKEDIGIFQFATTPLILNMMTWTYHGWSVEQCYKQFQNSEYREFNLFESYIKKILSAENIKGEYRLNQVLNWLNWLAQMMVDESKIIFLIENLQAHLLKNKQDKLICRIMTFILSGLIFTLSYVTFSFMNGTLNPGESTGYSNIISYSKIVHELSESLPLGLLFGIIGGIIASFSIKIILYEQMKWSWKKALFNLNKTFLSGFLFSLFLILLGILIETLILLIKCLLSGEDISRYSSNYSGEFITSVLIVLGVIFGFLFSIHGGFSSLEVQTQSTFPNQGIINSNKNSIRISIINGSIWGVVSGIVFLFNSDGEYLLFYSLSVGLFAGMTVGLILWVRSGGSTIIKHFILRQILFYKNSIPWNYARFLDHASELLLMKKIGGGYVFYHRMLMEHFANMELEE